MKIYTKTGDDGQTGLFGGDRVSKDSLRIEAYGVVDELNALLGTVRSSELPPEIDTIILRLQNDLFVLSADLATPHENVLSRVPHIDDSHVCAIETDIDTLDPLLPPLKNFILPGGTPAAAFLQLARTVCRRAERSVVRLAKTEQVGSTLIVYLNRLSDLLFVLARAVNHAAGAAETLWTGRPAQ
jgi:cob(I)alamin adenosyltransferase